MHEFLLQRQDGTTIPLLLKILNTEVSKPLPDMEVNTRHVCVSQHRLFVLCGDRNALELLQVQPAGKAAMTAKAFVNGLAGSFLTWQECAPQ